MAKWEHAWFQTPSERGFFVLAQRSLRHWQGMGSFKPLQSGAFLFCPGLSVGAALLVAEFQTPSERGFFVLMHALPGVFAYVRRFKPLQSGAFLFCGGGR